MRYFRVHFGKKKVKQTEKKKVRQCFHAHVKHFTSISVSWMYKKKQQKPAYCFFSFVFSFFVFFDHLLLFYILRCNTTISGFLLDLGSHL